VKVIKNLLLIGLLFSSTLLFSQELAITGKVVSASDGLPIPGVNILVEGTVK
jgi:hypothetical protein